MAIHSKAFFISFLGLFLFSVGLKAQSLTVETLAGTADVIIGNDDFTSYKNLNLDVHDNSGVRVYTWVQSDDPTNTTGHQADHDVYCQIYDKGMNAITAAFRVNKFNTADQQYPQVRIDQTSSSFVIAWGSNHGTDNYDVYAKKMDIYMPNPADIMNQNELRINVNTIDLTTLPYPYTGAQVTPYLAFDYAYGELIVAYRDQDGHDNYPATTGVSGVYARRINWSDFTLVKDVFLVNTVTVVDHQIPQDLEVSQTTGELMVAYQSNSTTNLYDVKLRKFSRLANGDWSGQSEIAINFTVAANQDGPQIILNNTTGDYVVAWKSTSQDGSGNGCYMRPFDKTGADKTLPSPWVNHEMRINIPTANNQQYPHGAWDEKSNHLIFFYLYTVSSTAYYKYQLINASTFAAVGVEMPACSTSTGEINTLYLSGSPDMNYSQKRQQVTLDYQIWNFTGGSPMYSKARSRSFHYAAAATDPLPCESNPFLTDPTYNWVQETTFDEFGNVISQSRQYSDKLGRNTQNQVRNIVENKVMVTATIYDALGRPVLNTLPAPACTTGTGCITTCFSYQPNIITNTSGAAYSLNDFDLPPNNLSQGELNNPKIVGTGFGTVGWYYSASNSYEAYVPTTGYPYSRVDYNDKGSNVNRASAPGDALRMGQGHEVVSASLPILWELNHYLKLRPYYVPGNVPMEYTFRGTKKISKDQNGLETVSFYDMEGKLLATCLSGSVNGLNQNTIGTPSYCDFSWVYNTGTFSISNAASNVEIYVNGSSTPYYIGTAAGAPTTFTAGSNLYIRSATSFTVNNGANSFPSLTQTGVRVKDYIDVHIPLGTTAPTITYSGGGGLVLSMIDLATGNTVSNLNNPGYYRIINGNSTTTLFVQYSLNYYNFSYYYYDDAGRLVATISPNAVNLASNSQPAMATTNEYNTLGWLLSTTNPDQGTTAPLNPGRTEFVYRKDGSLRFSQNPLQRSLNKFSYSNFNQISQLTESGEYSSGSGFLYFQNMKDNFNGVVLTGSVFTVLENTGNTGINSARCSEVTYTEYDSPDVAGLSSAIANYTQRYVNGNVSKTYKKTFGTDANNISTNWYSYNELGVMEWSVQNLNGLGVKTIDYTYDLMGNVLNVVYQKNTSSERFEHLYAYDVMKRIKTVSTRRLSTDVYKQQANYIYYLHGPLKRTEIENKLQGIDYTYTVNGQLKAINHPGLNANDPGADSYAGTNSGFSKDVFGMVLEYYDNDYTRDTKFSSTTNITANSKFNGLIRSVIWNTDNGNPLAQYVYSYDNKNQLTQANFGSNATNQFTLSSTSAYQVSNITYDNNGNLKSLKRCPAGGLAALTGKDNIHYNYTSNTNQLSSTDGTSNGNRTFTYDALGQMLSSVSSETGEVTKYVNYDCRGNVVAVFSDAPRNQLMVAFLYDERGARIRKASYYGTTTPFYTWYVRDASGNVISTYNTIISNPTVSVQTELPVYGNGRLGTASFSGSTLMYDYELKDHLGNIRAVVRRNLSNLFELSSSSDYYPHGSLMLGRLTTASTPVYRHGYQGGFAEKDNETGWDAFELRMYDSNLGRWFAPDPYGQYHSPYLGMGNNPVNMIDPDGGIAILDDIHLFSDGSMVIKPVEGSITNTYYYHTTSGTVHELSTVDKVAGTNLVKIPKIEITTFDDGTYFGFEGYGADAKRYMSTEAAGALFGSIYETQSWDLEIGNWSNSDGTSPSPSTSHVQGRNGDVSYLGKDRVPNYNINGANFSFERSSTLTSSLNKWGWKNILSERNSSGDLLPKTSHFNSPSRHYNHLHLQNFQPNVLDLR